MPKSNHFIGQQKNKKAPSIVDMIFFHIFAIKYFVNLFINLKII